MPTTTQLNALKVEIDSEGIATLWLACIDKPVVILNREFIQNLNSALDAIESNSDIKGLVLRSDSERVFVAGADLAEIDALDDHGLHAYLAFGTTVFARIAALPYPTVAAIHGAALGGGLELAMHCNALIFSTTNNKCKAYPVGLPEASLGICPGWGGTQLLPSRVHPELGITHTASGTTWMSDALPEGLANQVVETPQDLQDAAVSWIIEHSECGTTPLGMASSEIDDWNEGLATANDSLGNTNAVKAVLYAVETGISEGWSAAVAVEQCELVRLRNTPIAQEKLGAFLSKG